MSTLLLAALLSASSPTHVGMEISPNPEPTVILSGIRTIVCNGETQGSGFVVGENILATALHVADDPNCVDQETKLPLITYHRDEENDFALMRGTYPQLLAMRYSCEGYKKGVSYSSYGVSAFAVPFFVFRQYKVVPTGVVTDASFKVQGESRPGMVEFKGYMVPGLSGGPVIRNETGKIVGLNNVGTLIPTTLGIKIVGNESYSYPLTNTVLCKTKA